ncbi:MAG: hypothetical protein E6204_12595, partial [Eggerthella sp.]
MLEHAHHDVADSLIDARLGRFGHPATAVGQFRCIEKAGPLRLEGDVAQALVHAKAGDHVAGDVGGSRQIVRRPGRQLAEHQLFGGTPAQQYDDLVLEIGTRHQEAVFGGALQGVAQRADAARDDRDLVYGVGFGQRQRHQRMAHLVMGHGFPLLG